MISTADNNSLIHKDLLHYTRRICLRILFLSCMFQIFSDPFHIAMAQRPHSDPDDPVYREKVFLHNDRELYLTGECIRFSTWCVDWSTNRFVDVSKVLYIELLNSQSNSIIREKIRLEGGTAEGYIDIPRYIQTGVYYIRAYTHWMTNFDPSCFFMEKLYIVNPFLPIETSRTDTLRHQDISVSGDAVTSNNRWKDLTIGHHEELTILINKEKDRFASRESVILKMTVTDRSGKPASGKFSMSVYKVADHPVPEAGNICRCLYDSLWKVRAENPPAQSGVLPEIRGVTLTGRVYDITRQEPAANIRLYIAVPGKAAKLYNGRTQQNGQFYAQLLDQCGNQDIIVMPADNPERYSITLDDPFPDKYTEMENEVFLPGEDMIMYIRQLMINLQVEDAYGKLDHGEDLRRVDHMTDFYGKPDESVIMDDYIKLPALEEVFFEIVKSVRITRRRDQYELTIIDPQTLQPVPGQPLLLLDGVPVLDINPVMVLLDPEEIERIDVISSRYIIGDVSFSGIINVVTHDAGYHHFELPIHALRQSYQFFQVPAPFHSPDYSLAADSLRSIPDYRNTLYWDPDIHTNTAGEAEIRFYTADDIARYRIVIQGLSDQGLPGYAESFIITEQR